MRGNRLGLFLLYDFIQTFTCSRYFVTISEFILRKVYVVLVPASEFFSPSKKVYYSLPFAHFPFTYLHCCSLYSREI